MTPVERLSAAVPRCERRNEARFSSNFPWTRLRREDSAPCDESEIELVAGEIGAESQRTNSVSGLRTSGIAYALLGFLDESAERLERVERLAPDDPASWNDLAAVRYELAVTRNEPARLPSALSAVDHALSLSSSFPQARFNRALILTRLGIRGAAIRAWSEVAGGERDAAWVTEAAERLQQLRRGAAVPVRQDLDRAIWAAEGGIPAPLRAIVEAHPQEVRTEAETTILASWAAAARSGRDAEAGRVLATMERIGESLVAVNGDRLIEDIVRAVATASPGARRDLAAAHAAYRDARIDYARRKPQSAEKLCAVAAMFARAHSPMEYVARYYAANAMLDSNRFERSRAELELLLRTVDGRRYPSLAAGAERELGMYYGFRGIWTTSVTHLERAHELFIEQHETANAAFVEATIGEACDRIGDFHRGWLHRTAALDVLTRGAPDQRSVSVLIGAVHAEIMRADYASALSLLRVARREAENVAIPDITAEMMLREAQVLLITRERQPGDALAEAKRASATIRNDEVRHRVDAEIAVVEAAIVRHSDPARAVAIVTPAIEFFQSHELGILLPPAYLERGRAQLANGARAAARKDFNAGLRWIERQRANVREDIRTTLFDTVPELTSELVDLLLTDGDVSGAYAAVERARARTLVEALGVAQAPRSAGFRAIAAALPPKATVIEYALLPDDMAAFCITRNGLTVRRLGVKPAELRQEIAELRALIQARRPISEIRKLAARLHAALIAQVEPFTDGSDILYIVPDRFLNALPFPALYDSRSNRYLIQEHRLVLSPSGRYLCRGRHSAGDFRTALIIADPTNRAGSQRLDAARRSAMHLAALLDAPAPLVGRDATIDRFVAAAPKSGLIHYAGHANSDDTAGGFLPLAPSPGSDGRMDGAAISRLRLNNTSLVVLSACATMRGDASRVEGMPSLSRAFLNAHARAVIGMLWDVDEAPTARLLTSFYGELRSRTPPSLALQRAQLAMLTDPSADLRHPSCWAAAEFLGMD